MADLAFVKGDTRSYIALQLRYADGTPVNLAGNLNVVRVAFYAPESQAVAFEVVAEKVDGGLDGRLRVRLPAIGDGAVSGRLVGQVQIDFDGETQTIYERLSVFVREPFSG
jgi:hypothetical protein